jgi:O-antigen ligase
MRKIAQFFSQVLIFTIPWETAITISSLGTVTRLVGFGLAGIWVISVLITGKLRKLHPYHILFFFYMLFNIASIFWTVSPDLTLTRIKTFIQLAILTWILWDLFTTPASLRMAMQVFIFGAYLTIASQFFNFSSGQTIADYSDGRYTGAGQNANEFALILSLSLPLAWHLATTQKPGRGARILKVINFVYIPLAVFATILTASRTSLLTNIPALIYIAGTMRNIKPVYRLIFFFIIVLAFIFIYPRIPQATFDRLSTIGESIAGNDLGGRTRLWKGSFEIFLNHPYLGIGSNALSEPGQLGAFAHNTFLSILAELGLAGFLLFMGILSIVIFQAIRQPSPYSFLWITVITVWIVGALTLTWEYTKATWFFMNLVIISAGICKHQLKPIDNPSLSVVSIGHSNPPVAFSDRVQTQ